jgi:hypothetical protein
VARFITEVAAAIPCPPDYAGIPCLAVASVALGASRSLAVKPGHVQRSQLYLATVGVPGGGKTPALEKALEPLHDIEGELFAAWKEAVAEYEKALEADEPAKGKPAEKKADPAGETAGGKPAGEVPSGAAPKKDSRLVLTATSGPCGGKDSRPSRPGKPVLERVLVNNATSESMDPILQENPRGVLAWWDELTAWVQTMNQYHAGGRGGDLQFWLSLWSGVSRTTDRKGTHAQGPLYTPHPFGSVVGGLTPEKLPTIRGDTPRRRAEQDGGIDRILFGYPDEPPVEGENWAEIALETTKGWRAVIDKLRTLKMVCDQEGAKVKGWRPVLVKLTRDGRQAWKRFTDQHAAERNAKDFLPVLRGPWSKMRGYGARLALVLHYLRWACGEVSSETSDVDGESMDRAARLIEYFKSHAKRVYAAMDSDPRTPAARRLARWLAEKRLTRFKRRQAYRLLRGTFCRTVDEVDPVLDLLEKLGHIRPVPGTERGPGRPPSPEFDVHPAVSGYEERHPPGGDGKPAAATSSQTAHPSMPDDASGNCVHCVHSGPSESGSEVSETGSRSSDDASHGQDGPCGQGSSENAGPETAEKGNCVHCVHSVQGSRGSEVQEGVPGTSEGASTEENEAPGTSSGVATDENEVSQVPPTPHSPGNLGQNGHNGHNSPKNAGETTSPAGDSSPITSCAQGLGNESPSGSAGVASDHPRSGQNGHNGHNSPEGGPASSVGPPDATPLSPDDHEFFTERAAIREFDGQLPSAEAEALARKDLAGQEEAPPTVVVPEDLPPLPAAVLAHLRQQHGQPAFAAVIATAIGKPPGRVAEALELLEPMGLVRKVKKAWAATPGTHNTGG